METGLPHYQSLMEKYADQFEVNCSPSFSNLLWQMIINEAWAGRKTHCFVPVLSRVKPNHWEIGIAEQGETGYISTKVHFLKCDHDHAADTLDKLNEDMFGLLPRASGEIMLQSMRS